jgi:hypothetical protein
MKIRLIRTVCMKASERACCAGSRDSLLSATKGVTSARFEIHQRVDSAGARGASHLVVSP